LEAQTDAAPVLNLEEATCGDYFDPSLTAIKDPFPVAPDASMPLVDRIMVKGPLKDFLGPQHLKKK
jgi:hypothetical protein